VGKEEGIFGKEKRKSSNRRTGARKTDLDLDKASSRSGGSREGGRGIPCDERLELATESTLSERNNSRDPTGRGRGDLAPIKGALDELLRGSQRVGDPTARNGGSRRPSANVQGCASPKQLNALKRSKPLLEISSRAEVDLDSLGSGKSNPGNCPINAGALWGNRAAEAGCESSGRSIRRHVDADGRELILVRSYGLKGTSATCW